jgi:hypothetical protein
MADVGEWRAANARGEILPEQRDLIFSQLRTGVAGWLVLPALVAVIVLWVAVGSAAGLNPDAGNPHIERDMVLMLMTAIVLVVVVYYVVYRIISQRTRNALEQPQILTQEGVIRWGFRQYGARSDNGRYRFIQSPLHTLPGDYRLYTLAGTSWLLAYEKLRDPDPELITRTLQRANRLDGSALALNREGKLSSRQRLTLLRMGTASLIVALVPILSAMLLGWLLLRAGITPDAVTGALETQAVGDDTRLFLVALLVIGTGIALAMALVILKRLGRASVHLMDGWRGRAVHAEGEVKRNISYRQVTTHGRRAEWSYVPDYHYYSLPGTGHIRTTKNGYQAFVPGGAYHLYYSPRTKRLLNIEPV